MLNTAAASRAQVKDESVIVIGNRVEQSHFGFDNLLHVALHAFEIVVAFAINHDAMRHATYFELDFFEIADLERRVVEDVEVLSAEGIEFACNRWQSGGDLPAVCGDHAQR